MRDQGWGPRVDPRTAPRLSRVFDGQPMVDALLIFAKALTILAATGAGTAILVEGISNEDPWGVGIGFALLAGATWLLTVWF